MGLTGIQLASQVGKAAAGGDRGLATAIAPPTLTAAFWMLVLLIPLSVFFSAICLSLAVLARSMKEGQYYMTPLYLVAMPLIFLTLMPGIELNLFYSLVPITGVSLLLRTLIVGDYQSALRYFLPVLVPTVVYGVVALRWADRTVSARGSALPRGRAVRSAELGPSRIARQGADPDRRTGASYASRSC